MNDTLVYSEADLATGSIRPAKQILTVLEVASELRCSKAHVHNLINGKVAGAPKLPSIQLGRRRLVRLATLTAWIENNEQTASTKS
jgi:excisionase family DNA binding protein